MPRAPGVELGDQRSRDFVKRQSALIAMGDAEASAQVQRPHDDPRLVAKTHAKAQENAHGTPVGLGFKHL